MGIMAVLYVRIPDDLHDYIRGIAADAAVSMAVAMAAVLTRAHDENWSLARRAAVTVASPDEAPVPAPAPVQVP